jgi:SAM-dependent methyltransferase
MMRSSLIRQIAPPSLKNLLKSIVDREHPAADAADGEKGADWYDTSFENNPLASAHYTQSKYYFLWTVIADRLRHAGGQSVFEVGCGSGQLAALLRDSGIVEYCGLDFSPKRIAQARKTNPQFRFEVADAFETDLFEILSYDTVISTEFLEHVDGDLAILEKIRSGAHFLGTVPNFPFVSHVRHFDNGEDVAKRYSSFFDEFRVDRFFANDQGKTFFLLEGMKR